jgi:membrane dipeptidase
MYFMDGHCDVLLKLWLDPQRFSFYDASSKLDTSYPSLQAAQVVWQTFSIFVPPEVVHGQRFDCAIKQIDLFYEQIRQDEKQVFLITAGAQLPACSPSHIGALLHLEGAEALQGEIGYLRTFYRLGVRQLGLTWNHANEAADGIQEKRGGGLTRFGWEVIQEMKRLGMILDVSHLSLNGFWEVVEHSDLPLLASHSNSWAICPHIRNLADDQIKAIIQRQGLIGITFVPSFVNIPEHEATIDHVIDHIEHICELGGEDQLFFGSDFDGIKQKIARLENTSHLQHLKEALCKRYTETQVEKWAWKNGVRFYMEHLRGEK